MSVEHKRVKLGFKILKGIVLTWKVEGKNHELYVIKFEKHFFESKKEFRQII